MINRIAYQARLWLAAQLAPAAERPLGPAGFGGATGGGTLVVRRKHARRPGS